MVGRLVTGKLVSLDSVFSQGKHETLPPVHILTDGNDALTIDGHHRLSLASLYDSRLPANLYISGDPYITSFGTMTEIN